MRIKADDAEKAITSGEITAQLRMAAGYVNNDVYVRAQIDFRRR
jgi:hypothetical protein